MEYKHHLVKKTSDYLLNWIVLILLFNHMFVTIKLSGIVKPSPTFDLVSRPQSKKTIIQSLSDHLKKCKIFIPEDDDFYALFYCDG